MHALHILDHSIPLQSGYTFRTRNILRHQHEMGWKTSHLTGIKHTAPSASEETVDDLHFYRTASEPGLRNRLPVVNQWEVIRTLSKRLDEVIPMVKPDVLHAHSPALNGVAALNAGKKHNIPVVYECRAFWEDAAVDHGSSKEWGPRYRLTRALESYVFRNADAVTTICEGLRSDIVARNVEETKVTVIPNAVDVDQFSVGGIVDEELKCELGLQNRTVLGFIGSFYAYEGIPFLLRAISSIQAQHPEAALLLVGGGPQYDEVREQVAEAGLEKSVILTGRVPHSEVQKYYDLIDIFVYPRLKMRLTDLVTPLKPLEAMAQGRLVVASDVGGHQELIRDGYNGRLFGAGDTADLVRVLGELIGERSQWSTYQRNGRDFVENERCWEKSVARYQSVYGGIVK